jgi:hypothetical protein
LSARHVNVQPIAAVAPRRLVSRTLNHDANGNRVAESPSGVTKTLVDGALRWRFVYATDKHVPPAAIDAAGVVYRLVKDQVGSLRLVVRTSDGAVMQRMRHDAWGRLEENFVEAGFARVPFAPKSNSAGGLLDQVTRLVLSVHSNSRRGNTTPLLGGGWRRIRSASRVERRGCTSVPTLFHRCRSIRQARARLGSSPACSPGAPPSARAPEELERIQHGPLGDSRDGDGLLGHASAAERGLRCRRGRCALRLHPGRTTTRTTAVSRGATWKTS